MLLVSHDRELLDRAARTIAALELGRPATRCGSTAAVRHASPTARRERFARFEELRRRWDEQHEKLRELMLMYKIKAAYNDGMASRYQAAKTRLAKFEEAGPPQAVPLEQQVSMRLSGGRTGKRAIVVTDLELTGLMKPFSTEIWFGDRVAVLGSNGSGKSHFLRLLARGGSDPDVEHRPVGDLDSRAGRPHRARPSSAPGSGRAGSPRPTTIPSCWAAPCWRSCTAATHHRAGMGREEASRKLDRYELAHAAEQRFESLSGGQQARFQILLLELSGATLLLLDEPTDNLDMESAEALEHGLDAFEGTVVAVTHDRWFARSFDRFLVFGADGERVRGGRAGVGRGAGCSGPR